MKLDSEKKYYCFMLQQKKLCAILSKVIISLAFRHIIAKTFEIAEKVFLTRTPVPKILSQPSG